MPYQPLPIGPELLLGRKSSHERSAGIDRYRIDRLKPVPGTPGGRSRRGGRAGSQHRKEHAAAAADGATRPGQNGGAAHKTIR